MSVLILSTVFTVVSLYLGLGFTLAGLTQISLFALNRDTFSISNLAVILLLWPTFLVGMLKQDDTEDC